MASDPSLSFSQALAEQSLALGIEERPALGAEALAALREEAPGLHASLAIEQTVDDLWSWAARLATDDREAVLCGQTGYGIQSRFWILYWRRGPLLLLARVAFSALEDAHWAARSASGMVKLANELVRSAEHRLAAGEWPTGRLMLIMSDDLGQQGWCWVDAESLARNREARLDTRLGLAGAFEAMSRLPESNESANVGEPRRNNR